MGWGIFVGCMFMGMGLGVIFGNVGAGTLIGMGVGFMLSSVIRVERGPIRVHVHRPRIVLSAVSLIMGIFFVVLGLVELGVIEIESTKTLLGSALLLVGIALMIFGGSTALRRSSESRW